jgi:hypothetical protein
MAGRELRVVMETFMRGDADVLVATTIIENGIDVPSAGTILIDRWMADDLAAQGAAVAVGDSLTIRSFEPETFRLFRRNLIGHGLLKPAGFLHSRDQITGKAAIAIQRDKLIDSPSHDFLLGYVKHRGRARIPETNAPRIIKKDDGFIEPLHDIGKKSQLALILLLLSDVSDRSDDIDPSSARQRGKRHLQGHSSAVTAPSHSLGMNRRGINFPYNIKLSRGHRKPAFDHVGDCQAAQLPASIAKEVFRKPIHKNNFLIAARN